MPYYIIANKKPFDYAAFMLQIKKYPIYAQTQKIYQIRPVSIVEYKSQKKLKNEKLYSKPVSISQFILLFCHFLFLTYTTEEYNQNVG